MNGGFMDDLALAFEVAQDWRVIVVVLAFLFSWILVRYVATVYRKPRRPARKRSERKAAKPVPVAAPETDDDDFPDD